MKAKFHQKYHCIFKMCLKWGHLSTICNFSNLISHQCRILGLPDFRTRSVVGFDEVVVPIGISDCLHNFILFIWSWVLQFKSDSDLPLVKHSVCIPVDWNFSSFIFDIAAVYVTPVVVDLVSTYFQLLGKLCFADESIFFVFVFL